MRCLALESDLCIEGTWVRMAQKRTLKRQLNLLQVVMLGTAGTLGSGVFILTGHAAAVAGPAAIWAVLVAGILSFSIALNYCELATTYPETGGAMTYVREAWGKGLLAFLVGSMDSISSTFYTALSAVGFAYSVSVFVPALAESPLGIGVVAIAAILLCNPQYPGSDQGWQYPGGDGRKSVGGFRNLLDCRLHYAKWLQHRYTAAYRKVVHVG